MSRPRRRHAGHNPGVARYRISCQSAIPTMRVQLLIYVNHVYHMVVVNFLWVAADVAKQAEREYRARDAAMPDAGSFLNLNS